MSRKLMSIMALLSLSSLSGRPLRRVATIMESNSPLAPVETLIEDEKYQDAISELQRC